MKLIKVSTAFDIYLSKEEDVSKNKPIIFIRDKVFYRFMNCIYLPDHVYKLPPDFVKELNAIREQHALIVIDKEFNDLIINTSLDYLAKKHPSDSAVLDFGCGFGYAAPLIKNFFKDSKLCGIDIREPIQKELLTNYDRLEIQGLDEPMPFPDNSFDVVVSYFVFHFYVSNNQIKELTRVIKDQGTFFFNLINSADFEVLDRVREAGFRLESAIEFTSSKNSGRGYFYVLRKTK